MPDGTARHDVVWTDELDAMVIRLVGHDYTMSGIVDALSRAGSPVSRSEVAFRIDRLRLNGHIPIRQKKRYRPEPGEPAPRGAKARKAVLPRARFTPETEQQAEQPSEAASWADEITIREEPPADLSVPTGHVLRLGDPWPSRACRYPLFDAALDRGEPIFCGARVERAPYCEAHRRLVYLPAPSARDRADRSVRGRSSHQDRESPDGPDDTTEIAPPSR